MNTLKYEQIGDVALKCEIDLSALFQNDSEMKRFESKFQSFMSSHESHNEIFQLVDNKLSYISEQIIPTKHNNKPFLLMVFGNPASHSIKSGMFFSYEGKGKEHRFWTQILKGAGIADLNAYDLTKIGNVNDWRKDQLLSLKYDSLFRIGLTVLFTLPSPSIGEWSGVAGVKKLFGANAFKKLAVEEAHRLKEIAFKEVKKNGAVITFQKDAWLQLADNKESDNYLTKSKGAKLKSTIDEELLIYGLPPTRNAGPCKMILNQFAKKLHN